MQCKNCGTTLSCGCSRRLASNGKECCKKCVGTENIKIQQLAKQPTVKHIPNSPPK